MLSIYPHPVQWRPEKGQTVVTDSACQEYTNSDRNDGYCFAWPTQWDEKNHGLRCKEHHTNWDDTDKRQSLVTETGDWANAPIAIPDGEDGSVSYD